MKNTSGQDIETERIQLLELAESAVPTDVQALVDSAIRAATVDEQDYVIVTSTEGTTHGDQSRD